jgi:hypothetical protein
MSSMYAPSLIDLASSPFRGGGWWAAVARALDTMDESLSRSTPAVPAVPDVEDRPDLVPPAMAIAREGNRVRARITRLRAMVRRVAGDGAYEGTVSAELAIIARDVDRLERRSRWILWESVNRDHGGG